METIILASTSPRRKEILEQMDLPFLIKSVPVNEIPMPGELCVQTVERLAALKVNTLLRQFGRKGFPWIIGADTLVEHAGTQLGKPANADEAGEMLKKLSGTAHNVVSGIALFNGYSGQLIVRSETTEVVFAELSQSEITWYLQTMEWQGAAGGYRIQERGACLIERINGSYSNVMGLPIRAFYGMLRDNEYPFA